MGERLWRFGEVRNTIYSANGSNSYCGNFITAPPERNYWLRPCPRRHPLTIISVWAATGTTVISCSSPCKFPEKKKKKKQLEGTSL